jgi:membrane protein implicated in regulation of membrane protease activity
MLSIYIGGLLFGGVLLGATVVGGHGDHGGGHGGGGHGGGHGHGPGGDQGDGHGHGDDEQSLLLPLFSLRFWAFASAFFGLSGLALTFAGGLGAVLTPVVAGAMGLGCGYGSSRVLGALSRRPVGLVGSAEGHVGREAKVLLPIGRGQRGKIRLQIGGTSTDMVAETEGEGQLLPGETALVVGMRGNVALVEISPAALPGGPGRLLGGPGPGQ